MSELPDDTAEAPAILQADFERVTSIVSAEFPIDQALMEHGIPTYYLKQPQETKQAFLRVLKNLETMNLIAILRRIDGKIVLRVALKPSVKPSNILINWVLLFATIATTFYTGYLLSGDSIDPIVSGIAFMIAMMAVLGTHEMGHKITANKKGIEATPPYFIPGLPPLGTFGAVIMQKSLPPNRDALFDVGADGPIAGFIVATIVSIVGLTLSVPTAQVPGAAYIQPPLAWVLLVPFLQGLNLMPVPSGTQDLLLHPIAFAGWVGILVTMLNLLPAGMLDGGHVARSIASEKLRIVFTALSILYLLVLQSYLMAILVVFFSMYRHPGPLDDVSSLSLRRKLLIIFLIAVFILCLPPSFRLL